MDWPSLEFCQAGVRQFSRRTRIVNKTGNASMNSTHMFIALLHLKMIFPYLPIGNANIYIYIYVCVCVICYICYICSYICSICYICYICYIYIYTQYITLCVSHESWFMWDSPNATMALNQVSTVSHWDVAALAREFQVTKSERRDLAAARTRKQKLLGTLLFNREVNFWHFELTVVYSSIFKLNTLTFFLMSSETDLLHSLKTSKKKKKGFFRARGRIIQMEPGAVSLSVVWKHRKRIWKKNLALWQLNLADLPFTIWLWLTVSELENHHAINR